MEYLCLCGLLACDIFGGFWGWVWVLFGFLVCCLVLGFGVFLIGWLVVCVWFVGLISLFYSLWYY